MKKITEYSVLVDTNAESLSSKVNEKIKEGWQPFGSISTSRKNDKALYPVAIFQAIVKYED